MSSTIASIACIGTGRLAHARVMPLNSFWRSNASRRPSCLMTISDVCATRSYVVKRCPHLRHSRRRRIASSDSRVSMTLLSSFEQYGQRMDARIYVPSTNLASRQGGEQPAKDQPAADDDAPDNDADDELSNNDMPPHCENALEKVRAVQPGGGGEARFKSA